MTSVVTFVPFGMAILMTVGLARSLRDRQSAGEVRLDAGPVRVAPLGRRQ